MNRSSIVSPRGALTVGAATAALAVAAPAAMAASPPPAKVGTTVTVQGIGALRLNSQAGDVRDLLGKPARVVRRTVNNTDIQVFRYPRYGLAVVLDAEAGGTPEVMQINVNSRRYRMVNTGLRVGATRAQVQKAYPQGECGPTKPGAKAVICTDNGGEGGVNFVLRNGRRVSSIFVND